MPTRSPDIVLILVAALAPVGLAQGLSLDPMGPPEPNAPPRVLHFPPDQCVGTLHPEPEAGLTWNLPLLGPDTNWQRRTAAQGDVQAPAGRRLRLVVDLELSPREQSLLRRIDPGAYQLVVADCVRRGVTDLSFLTSLEPNDLHRLSVGTEARRRLGVDQQLFAPISHLTGLRSLDLSHTGLDGEGMARLGTLGNLRTLELWETNLRAKDLAVLAQFPKLEYLDLDIGVTDAGLREVARCRSLRWLRLSTGRFWGPGLAALKDLPHLERLCLCGRQPISDRHLKALERVPQLRALSLWGVAGRVTDEGLASICRLENLEELYFIRTAPRFTLPAMKQLASLQRLRRIDLGGVTWRARQGGDLVARVLAGLPSLEAVESLGSLSAQGLATLAGLSGLRSLSCDLEERPQGAPGPTGLAALAALDELESLRLGCRAACPSGADWAALASLPRLRKLVISGSHLDGEALRGIAGLRHLEHLQIMPSFGGPALDMRALSALGGLTHLRFLDVGSPHGPAANRDGGEVPLDLSGLQSLETLNLNGGLPLREGDLAFLERLPCLRDLYIASDTPLSGRTLGHVLADSSLEDLRISGLGPVRAGDLAGLSRLKNLEDLSLSGDISDAALQALCVPGCNGWITIRTAQAISAQTREYLESRHPHTSSIHIEEPFETTRSPPRRGLRSAPQASPRSRRTGRR